MDVAILLGILKRCVHLQAASQLPFILTGVGFTALPVTGKAGLTREQLGKEMEQWMDAGEEIRQPCIATSRLYIP